MKRVVVTGFGMINALGLDAASAFENIVAGKCGVRKIESFDASDFPVQIAAEIDGFDPASVVDAKEVKKFDRFIVLGLKAAQDAVALSGVAGAYGAGEVGVSSGAGIGGLPAIERNSLACKERGARRVSPFFIPSALVNMLSGMVAIANDFKGPSLASVTACAASTHAICEAAKTIMLGEAKAMVVVGAESAICPIGIGGFAAMKALSTRNDDPAAASRPFDARRDGFVMGEGAGALVLEELDAAQARGAKIYAELIGFGESGDAYHITMPNLDGPKMAMEKALKMSVAWALRNGAAGAGLVSANLAGAGCCGSADLAGAAGSNASACASGAEFFYEDGANSNLGELCAKVGVKIDYINAHGTSTPANDRNETAAIKAVFGDFAPAVSSTKGQTGHCLGGAGAIEAVIGIMAMQRGVIPPTINYTTPDADCDLDYVPNVARQADLKVVMSNSFGFGGTNGCVVFRKF